MPSKHFLCRDAPLDCWTCVHRVEGVGKYQTCREHISTARDRGPWRLSCSYAYDTFCGGRWYRPTLAARIARLWKRITAWM